MRAKHDRHQTKGFAIAAGRVAPEITVMDAGDVEYEVLRRMQPAKKLEVMRALLRQAYELKVAGVRLCRPDLSEAEVWKQARELVTRDRS